MLYKKSGLFTLLVLITLNSFGQANTNSPYSRFGLGELNMPGFGQNRAMGASGIALRSSNQLNYMNPASYTAIDTMSFLFDFGLMGSSTRYETNDNSAQLRNMNLDHLAIGFAINKWWSASAGVAPYSSTGYNILDQQTHPDIGLLDYSFTGEGGLNRFYMGTSVMLFQRVSLGLNLTNYFGYIEHAQGVSFPTDAYASRSYAENRMVITGMVLNLGMQYHQVFNDKFFVNLGLVYDNETKLNGKQNLLQQNFFPGQAVALNDTTIITPEFDINKSESDIDVIYPRRFGAGVAFGIKDILTLTGDYSTQEWSNSKLAGINDSLVNSDSYNFGMEYTPDPDALRGYFKRVHYRLGGYYSNSYLRIRGEQLQDYGITFGVGLPFKGTKTTFNLGMVLGQRGTLENNLIKENYGIINLSFTLHDFWFFKRKFD